MTKFHRVASIVTAILFLGGGIYYTIVMIPNIIFLYATRNVIGHVNAFFLSSLIVLGLIVILILGFFLTFLFHRLYKVELQK